MRRIVPFVGGRPLMEVGAWESVKYSHGWPYGSLRASWQMRDRIRHPRLTAGAVVDLKLGGVTVWRGELLEPGRDGAMQCVGAWERAKGAVTLAANGSTTSEPRDAVSQAVARGVLRWATPIPQIYAGTAAQQMDAPYPAQTVAALLDYVTQKNGTRWTVDSYTGLLVVAPDPTTPEWRVPHLVAGAGLTPADDSTVTHLIGEYITGPGQRAVTPPVVSPDYIAGTPPVEKHVGDELIGKGFLTEAQAVAYLQGMFGQAVGKVGWADGLALRRGDVLTMRGTVADPAMVVAGPDCMLRLDGVWDDRAAGGPAAATDIVAATTEYDEDTDSVQVTPVGKQARTVKELATWLTA
ncbi:hypothetical protein [Nocardioides sp. SYSU D00065]|uniref:hypothetical protein n=1 Tax=Nocardioides sp. SYSU D00065 TaxID=2817378 RepID=UPI001B342809|nr:hypothetical protein [Nocardioides sp. SYSU D00065]